MDEDQYRSAYNDINPIRCVFEKAITNQRCDCELKRKFVVATREGVGCEYEAAQEQCKKALDLIRNNARFSLKVVTIGGPLPHNKELQVQAGGMLALQQLTGELTQSDKNTETNEQQTPDTGIQPNQGMQKKPQVANIYKTLQQALIQYGSIENLPFSDIMKGIVNYQSRPKRKKR